MKWILIFMGIGSLFICFNIFDVFYSYELTLIGLVLLEVGLIGIFIKSIKKSKEKKNN